MEERLREKNKMKVHKRWRFRIGPYCVGSGKNNKKWNVSAEWNQVTCKRCLKRKNGVDQDLSDISHSYFKSEYVSDKIMPVR